MQIHTHFFFAQLHTLIAPRQAESVTSLVGCARAHAAQARYEWITQTARHLEQTHTRDVLQTYYDAFRGPVVGAPLDTYELAFSVATEYWRLNPQKGIAEAATLTVAEVREWINAECRHCQAGCRFAGVGRTPEADDERVRCQRAGASNVVQYVQ